MTAPPPHVQQAPTVSPSAGHVPGRKFFVWTDHDITRDQLRILLITWATWTLGAMDTMIYSLVLTPALKDLLQAAHPGETISTGLIGWYGGIIFSTFLMGWAVGGVFLASLADYVGRRRILMLSIALVAGSTALAALSQSWWHLAAVRFVTGVGIGGLWAAGAALVAEVWPEHSRSRAAGFLQSAWGFGFFLAAALNLLVKGFGWRGCFAIGIFTLGSAWLIARYIHDSGRWNKIHAAEQRAQSSPHVRIASLFSEPYRRATWTGTGLAFVAVFGLWGATNWTPSLIQALPDVAPLEPAVTATYVSYAVMVLNVGALVGYFSFGLLADRFGRKPTFALMCGGSLLLIPATFSFPHSYGVALALLPILGFFTKGVFGGFPLYFPELYPTRLRSTGAGFCYNAGRIVASSSPFLTGALVSTFGSFGLAASAVAAIYVAGLVILPFAIETKNRPLSD
ncbi:MAG: MFS transporter [Nitrospira sp.]|nr:MFS transporter [Nitrospira sp.]